MSGRLPLLSVVVPIKSGNLDLLIRSLMAQTLEPRSFELIVVAEAGGDVDPGHWQDASFRRDADGVAGSDRALPVSLERAARFRGPAAPSLHLGRTRLVSARPPKLRFDVTGNVPPVVGEVPHAQRAVQRCGCERPSVGGEVYCHHRPGVSLERRQRPA